MNYKSSQRKGDLFAFFNQFMTLASFSKPSKDVNLLARKLKIKIWNVSKYEWMLELYEYIGNTRTGR